MPVKVSILLQNLDNSPYLDERIRSIMAQTFANWELTIVDPAIISPLNIKKLYYILEKEKLYHEIKRGKTPRGVIFGPK